MAETKPYSSRTDSKKSQVRDMFNKIAPGYDRLNRLFSLGLDVSWRNRLIRNVMARQPQRILDVATGTGDLAIAFAKKNVRVTGFDLAPEMLEKGRQKAQSKNLSSSLEFVEGDAENMPFEVDSFDAVTVAFGVRNFENLDAGLKEMARILRPGCQVAILEFGKPKAWFRPLFYLYFRGIMPLLARILSRDPAAYTYLPASVAAFPSGADFIARLKLAGFVSAKAKPLTAGVCWFYTAQTPQSVSNN